MKEVYETTQCTNALVNMAIIYRSMGETMHEREILVILLDQNFTVEVALRIVELSTKEEAIVFLYNYPEDLYLLRTLALLLLQTNQHTKLIELDSSSDPFVALYTAESMLNQILNNAKDLSTITLDLDTADAQFKLIFEQVMQGFNNKKRKLDDSILELVAASLKKFELTDDEVIRIKVNTTTNNVILGKMFEWYVDRKDFERIEKSSFEMFKRCDHLGSR